ncbi:hypothetical protein [Mycoplasma suis]|uniref:hypothetical protein n=1 Tax=Mycoplasma suis TaxID=57372 RepID=UPI0005C626F2|nr:hypothetical protein [Mycoplasma suis]
MKFLTKILFGILTVGAGSSAVSVSYLSNNPQHTKPLKEKNENHSLNANKSLLGEIGNDFGVWNSYF